jgi:lipopolysaccharide transport system permease protein
MIVTYEPDNLLKKGYFNIFGDIIDEIKRNRWLIYQFFKRDFFAFYKQSLLGFIWAIIMPLASVFTFVLLNRSGLFSIGEINVPYPIYALLGLAFWQLFSNGLLGSSNSLIKAGPMILKINFSKKSLVIASAGQSIISFLILLALVAILLMWYGIAPHCGYLLIPIMLIPLLLLTIGLGFVIALLNGLMRDIGHMISILLTFFLFLTPILYAMPKTGTLSKMTYYNPLYYLISAPREMVLTGTISEWRGFLVVSAISVVVFIICLVAFHLTETRVAERI